MKLNSGDLAALVSPFMRFFFFSFLFLWNTAQTCCLIVIPTDGESSDTCFGFRENVNTRGLIKGASFHVTSL